MPVFDKSPAEAVVVARAGLAQWAEDYPSALKTACDVVISCIAGYQEGRVSLHSPVFHLNGRGERVSSDDLQLVVEDDGVSLWTSARHGMVFLGQSVEELPHLRRQMLTWAKSMTAEVCSIADTLIEMSRPMFTRG